MRKFLAVVKREFVQRVRAKMFIVSTVLLPLVMALFGIVPAIVLNIDAGGPCAWPSSIKQGRCMRRCKLLLRTRSRRKLKSSRA